MLLNINDITKNNNLDIQGVIHIGAHHGQELENYVGNDSQPNVASSLIVEGRIGIGTTSPDYLLDVDGVIRVQTTIYSSDKNIKKINNKLKVKLFLN